MLPVNFRLTPADVAFTLRDCSASALIVDSELASLVSPMRDQLAHLRQVVVLGDDGGVAGDAAERFEKVLASSSGDPLDVRAGDHDPALIMYTSGTTGRPKGAVLSHFNMIMGNGGEDEVWYANLPLFHIGGLSSLLPYVITGGCSVIVPSTGFDPFDAVEDLVRYGAPAACS